MRVLNLNLVLKIELSKINSKIKKFEMIQKFKIKGSNP